MNAVRVIVTGRVQGVGYRWFTRDAARAHGLTGWVRNRHDGAVEALLQGPESAVDAVLAVMQRGPKRARVKNLSTTDAPDEPPLTDFDQRPTV